MKSLSEFIKLYPVQKTLRFELKPIGATAVRLEESKLLSEDFARADAYPRVKEIIDDYHRWFIDSALSEAKDKGMDWGVLATAMSNAIAANKKDGSDKAKEQFEALQDKYRAQITKIFEGRSEYKLLFKKDLLASLIPNHADPADAEAVNKELEVFQGFSTYFTGFHENRANIYSKEKIVTAIPFRIVHVNFPKFLDDVRAYGAIKSKIPEVVSQIETEVRALLKERSLTKLDDVFSVDFYNNLIAQKDIEWFNSLVGGLVEKEGKRKLRGINEVVNNYLQQHDGNGVKPGAMRMIPLYKQILSIREGRSFAPKSIKNDEELLRSVNDFYEFGLRNFEINGEKKDILKALADSAEKILHCDLDKIYVKGKYLTEISMNLFEDWQTLSDKLRKFATTKYPGTTKKSQETIKKYLESDVFPLLDIKQALNIDNTNEDFGKVKDASEKKDVFRRIFIGEKDERIEKREESKKDYLMTETISTIDCLNKKFRDIEICPMGKVGLGNSDKICVEENRFRESSGAVEVLKEFLDALLDYMHIFETFYVEDDKIEKDADFYSVFTPVFEQMREIIPLYNKVRNYITQKPGDVGKMKLNFSIPPLANGWSESKIKDNRAIILIRDGKYFLGVMNPRGKIKFNTTRQALPGSYQKMVYNLLPGPNKMLPKVFLSEKGKKIYSPSKEIIDGYDEKKHLKGDNFDRKFMHKLIDFFKRSIEKNKDWNPFEFKFSKTEEYEYINDFYREVAEQGYKVSFENIPCKEIDALVNDGKLFLFQIYNKDFAPGSTGRPNMHTILWKNVFSPQNLGNVVLKLNGEAELFYREKAIGTPYVHKAGEVIVNRFYKSDSGEYISMPEDLHGKLVDYKNNRAPEPPEAKDLKNIIVSKLATHDITKDRRYTMDKYLFHVPITINFKKSVEGSIPMIDAKVWNEFLKGNPDVKIIGLDRGERHLLYLSLIDQKGKIIKQKTLNIVEQTKGDKCYKIDYQKKLHQREDERDKARKSWSSIAKIKDLKDGYLSLIIHEIATMMVEENAIVVLEDLNFGFKRGRFKVERQVYQKFEKMLIDKLNYLSFKDRNAGEIGGILNGYQLTDKFESFEKLGKQSGFLFYVPAAFTSKIDPTTGFANVFRLDGLTNITKKKEFFGKFEKIFYDEETKSYCFKFDYKKFDVSQEFYKTDWEVYSRGPRICYLKKEKRYEDVDVTGDISALLEKAKIKVSTSRDLLPDILKIDDTKFFDGFFRVFKLLLQMRNSDAKRGKDYILSPVKNATGGFYDSSAYENEADAKLPKDADANGAYHIALKGLLLLKRNQNSDKADLKIANGEWFKFVQSREFER
ncbi:MAG: type V CRISPR-associated protein Cas12a/Cpf1 [Opitutae bacterium]|nr:type V CRISPR-associated protein Cas12a/Cpf1 [Opitutae bacterium]